jgi:hypothetical protein
MIFNHLTFFELVHFACISYYVTGAADVRFVSQVPTGKALDLKKYIPALITSS